MLYVKTLVTLACVAVEVQGQLMLGTAKSFGTLAGSQLINTGTTWVGGDIGTYPGTSITGYPPGTLTGTINPGTVLAQDGQKYCTTAYKKGWTLTPTVALPTPDLSGLNLPPGVYSFPAPNVVLNTFLTINGAANPNGQWIFLIKGSFTTAVNSYIQTINGAQACNIYFIVANSAGLGDATRFNGNILAYDTIKVGKGSSNYGTFCTVKGPIATIYDKLQSYTPTCFY